MGLSFFVGEVEAQTSAAVQMAHDYLRNTGTLRDSINAYLNAPLSGKTYNSARNYFRTVYPPIATAMVLVGESMIEAQTQFPAKFEEIVGGGDIEEDRIKQQIEAGRELLRSYAAAMNKEEKPNFRMEKAYMMNQDIIGKLEERLEDLYLFNSISPALFSDVETNMDNLDRAIAALNKGGAWNAASGTFDITKLDMTWVRPINEAWKKRQEELSKRPEVREALDSVNYDVEITVDEFGNPNYYVYKNGKLDTKLTAEYVYLMAEFRLAEYKKLMDSPVGKVYTTITSVLFIVNGTQYVINGLRTLGNGLSIGYGVNAVTGEPATLLLRADGSVVSEALATVSVGIVELLTGVSISTINWGESSGGDNPKVVSKIDENARLRKEAEEMGKNEGVQKEADQLIEKLAAGNTNPGIGYRNLFKDVIYIRGKKGARIFYRKVDGVIEILGKAYKGNETKVINILIDLYK
ncbi:hypothetical protein ACYSNR_03785 [Enterococcus sp. LJL128]